MIEKLNRRYEVPSCNYFSCTALQTLYDETCLAVASSLNDSGVKFFAATTDLHWMPYTIHWMPYTIHYINSTWEPKCHTFKTRYLLEDHIGENIKEELLTILNEWNLPEQKQVLSSLIVGPT